ncbi:hypothetical protein FRC20_000627 [Serendipita sp. 405]|nr:hypothetical protein FRC20_000627 [Serendipita sp. 405]
MQETQRLLRLLNTPNVREQTKAVFRSLLANCEDEKRLCSFVLESVRDRVNERFQSELDHCRTYGLPAIHMTEELRVKLESEALNDEARRWMADFLLYPIGKRTRTIRRSARLLKKSTRRGQDTILESSHRGPYAQSTEVGRRVYEVELFPKSDDSVRLSRFRVLVDVFHRGYQTALRDTNLQSRSNTVLIDRRWISMFDNGAFHLCFDDEQVCLSSFVRESITDMPQVCAVPLWDEAAAIITPSSPINRKSTLRPRNRSVFRGPIGPDKELVSLHALILQTWFGTGMFSRRYSVGLSS